MKKVNLAMLLTFLMVLTTAVVGWAEDPTQLVVVRANDNSLWKSTCLGTTCSAFTSFPGMFGSQPTVIWDENLKKFVLWGRAANNTIWRSTFSQAGVFQNDWVQIPGLTTSPPGAAGSALKLAARSYSGGKGNIAVIDIAWPRVCTAAARTRLATITPTSERAGRILIYADGIYAPGVVGAAVDVCISDSTGACLSWTPVLASQDLTYYNGEKRFALHWSTSGPVGPGTSTYYLTACADFSATSGTLYWDTFEAIQVPENY